MNRIQCCSYIVTLINIIVFILLLPSSILKSGISMCNYNWQLWWNKIQISSINYDHLVRSTSKRNISKFLGNKIIESSIKCVTQFYPIWHFFMQIQTTSLINFKCSHIIYSNPPYNAIYLSKYICMDIQIIHIYKFFVLYGDV